MPHPKHALASERRKLLVIRLGAMGDLIHAATALSHWKAALSDNRQDQQAWDIHWLTTPAYASLVTAFLDQDGAPLAHQVWTYDKRQGWPGLFQMGQTLRQSRPDAVVNWHPSFKTWTLSQWSGSPIQAIYRKEKLALRGQEQRTLPRRHAIQDFYEPLRQITDLPALADTALEQPVRLRLPRQTTLSDTPAPIGLIIGVGGKRGNRAWPVESYQALIGMLLSTFSRPIWLIGGPEEAHIAQALMHHAKHAPELENHCGQYDIPGTAALMSRCSVVIGGDTGPLHLASTLYIPVISVFGPTSSSRTGPAGPTSLRPTLQPQPDLTCWPCELARCPLHGEDHLACMKQITPQSVFEACLNVLKPVPS